MNYTYDSKWVRQIIDLQHTDGSWGYFHTLSKPTKDRPITTEQALRRLEILGLTKNDDSIQKALGYMRGCLSGKQQIPDNWEKGHNWDIYINLMLSTWIRRFDPQDTLALQAAQGWTRIITCAFSSGLYEHEKYISAFEKYFSQKPRGGRLIDFSQFYIVSLLQGLLDGRTEAAFVNYIITHDPGIYYVYDKRIADLPKEFASRQANAYLAALEYLEGYSCAGEKLKFATEWIKSHQDENGQWDMGTSVKDCIHFPLSDSWRKLEDRKKDCTIRIERLLERLESVS